MEGVVAVECCTYQEEQGRDRDVKVAAKEGGELGIFIALGCEITLHIVLVDAIILEVDEDAIDETYPEGGFGEGCAKGSQRELVALGSMYGDVESLKWSFWHTEK